VLHPSKNVAMLSGAISFLFAYDCLYFPLINNNVIIESLVELVQ
jgi:hypothetical protein